MLLSAQRGGLGEFLMHQLAVDVYFLPPTKIFAHLFEKSGILQLFFHYHEITSDTFVGRIWSFWHLSVA